MVGSPIARARLAGFTGLGVSVLVFWGLGDTLLARSVWGATVLAFVAVCAYRGPAPDRRGLTIIALTLLAFLIALPVRLAGIDHLALGLQGDESATALAAEHVLHDGAANLFRDRSFGIPTLGYLWFTPLIQIMPSPIEAVRATSAVAGAATVAMVAVWGAALGSLRLAVLAGALMATSHTALYLSHLGTSNSVALFFATAVEALLTIALVRHSWLAAALTGVALVGVWCTWAGAREVLPVFALAPLVVWRGSLQLGRLGPFAVATAGAALMLAGPALAVGAQNLPAFLFPRSDTALSSPGGWAHTAQGAGTSDPLGIAQFQLGRVLSAFQPDTFGDRSPFYHFGRPIVDTLTLGLAIIGFVASILAVRQRRAWLLPVVLILTVFLTSMATINPPDYPRLSPMLPGLALLAAVPLAWLWSRGRRGLLLAIGAVTAIGVLNLWWFFVDYPREGQGDFEHVLLLQLAGRGPVYVVTPNFYFAHETLLLLDPQHQVQPPPSSPDPNAAWVALGPDAQAQLAQVQPRVPADTLRTFTDNSGRIVLYALLPS